MIGIYDYTVILTYLSLASATLGTIISLTGNGHPYIGAFFLLFCGLCDAFDGKVARTKKDRTDSGRKFGIQIDSLSDVVAFGVLPACIGYAALNTSPLFRGIYPQASAVEPPAIFKELFGGVEWYFIALKIAIIAVLVLFSLAALIRLAYFNVKEDERMQTAPDSPTTYTGLPVTSSALIFPTVLLLRYIFDLTLGVDLTPLYFVTMLITGYLFLAKFSFKKPTMKQVLIMVAIGAIEFIAISILLIFN
ncbi:MAG: CDP-alcohol phosphatidyltransferase family protein [Clostridia bacterium]|nr:CDP-alcohol phosphatidyltransferase family protein [Clostridia bacterium]